MTNWAEIVHRHRGVVWQTAFRLLGNRDDAADCFQETFLAALELSRRQRVRNWPALLRRLCTCRALDELRRRLRLAARRDEPGDWSDVVGENPGPVQQAQAAELSERLREALADLPERQAEVFCLRFVSDLSYREIARALGLRASAVGALLHRARKQLREVLSDTVASEDVEVLP